MNRSISNAIRSVRSVAAAKGFRSLQAALVLAALKHYRVPRTVGARMAANVLLDIAVGAIPLLGDLFDVVFKANTANLKLLEPFCRDRDISEAASATSWAGGGSLAAPYRRAAATRSGGTPWRYVLPLAAVLVAALSLMIIGLVTVIGLNLATLIGATVIVEQIFGVPGIGFQLLKAINNRDVPLVEGIVLAFATIVVLANLATDLLYDVLDPRIRHGRSRS